MKTRTEKMLSTLLLRLAALALIGAGLVHPYPAAAGTNGGLCIRDAGNLTQGGVCSANDVRVARFDVLGTCSSSGSHNGQACVANTATDPCIVEGGTCVAITSCIRGQQISVPIRATITPGANKDRFDVGFFIAQDGGDAVAHGGVCYRDFLRPTSSTNADLQVMSGHGPYYNGEIGITPTDTCGDIAAGQMVLYDIGAVAMTCMDPDGSGILHVGTCLSWDTNNQSTCNSEADAFPKSSSKCSCASIAVGVVAVCGDGIVTAPEQCDDGANNGTAGSCCTTACTFKSAGTTCRPAAGDCDLTEVCSGSAAACPANAFKPSTTVCRPSAGACDPAESCTGSSASCPADAKSTAVCRPAAGQCDLAESCDGTGNDCPPDTMKSDGTACNDGNACTRSDACQSGACVGSDPVVCSAADQCHLAGACAPATGVCSSPAKLDDTPCDDGDGCTTSDVCKQGSCTGGLPRDCNDQNPCTDDTCSGGQCVNTPNSGSCDDGNPCTLNDACSGGTCIGDAKSCADTNVCNGTEVCDPASAGGDCLAGMPLDCDDHVVCTADDCDPGSGCVHTPIDGCCSADVGCDDHDVCTGTETCDTATGKCNAGGHLDCDDLNVCTADGCDPESGCTHMAVPGCCNQDTDCDDQNACTADTCVDHLCHHGERNCSDGDVCNGIETCDPVTGACRNGDRLGCDDGIVCTTDDCDSQMGCTHASIAGCCRADADCDDRDVCTGVETCITATGMCQAGSRLDCDDHDACTDDRCDATDGCAHDPITCDSHNVCNRDECDVTLGCVTHPVPDCCNTDADCLDANVCNGIERCVDHACAAGMAPTCDDQDPCTDDSCDMTGGCMHVTNTSPCDDGNACTRDDACKDDQCAGTALDCNDHDPCTDDSCLAGSCVHAGACTTTTTLATTTTTSTTSTTTTTTTTTSTTTTILPTTTTTTTTSTTTSTTMTGPATACPLSAGFWKNHPALWPSVSLTLGSQSYTEAELMKILNTPTGSPADASLILADQLIAAKLNVVNGADPTPISGTLADADGLLDTFASKLPYKVNSKSNMGKAMIADANTLQSYNTGRLTPGCAH